MTIRMQIVYKLDLIVQMKQNTLSICFTNSTCAHVSIPGFDFFFECIKREHISHFFWNKNSYLWWPVCNSFVNSFCMVEILALKTSEVLRSFHNRAKIVYYSEYDLRNYSGIADIKLWNISRS